MSTWSTDEDSPLGMLTTLIVMSLAERILSHFDASQPMIEFSALVIICTVGSACSIFSTKSGLEFSQYCYGFVVVIG